MSGVSTRAAVAFTSAAAGQWQLGHGDRARGLAAGPARLEAAYIIIVINLIPTLTVPAFGCGAATIPSGAIVIKVARLGPGVGARDAAQPKKARERGQRGTF